MLAAGCVGAAGWTCRAPPIIFSDLGAGVTHAVFQRREDRKRTVHAQPFVRFGVSHAR